jgi:hypothetical protein
MGKSMGLRLNGRSRSRIPAAVLLCAASVFVSTNLASYFFFRHIPHIHDEIAYLFQARIFSLGRAHVPSPSSPSSFDFPHMINNGKWYSQYPPGFPLLLVPGVLMGIPWMINPLLAALSIILFYKLGREIYGESVGLWAAVLGTLSIWFLLTSSTMLSHTSSMFFFAMFVLYAFRSFRSPTFRHGLLAGLGLGAAFLIRPYNVAAVSLPILALYGIRSVSAPRPRLRNPAGLAVVLLAAALCLLIYNQMTTGSALRMGYIEKYGETHAVGFGRTGYMGVPHTPGRGLFLVAENLEGINKYLFGWPLSSLLFLVPFLIPIQEDRKRREADLCLALSFLSLATGLYFYWGAQVSFGPRMFFEALPLLLLITARGLSKTPVLLSRLMGSPSERPVRRSLPIVVGLLAVFAFAHTFPRWVEPPHTRDYYRTIAHDYAGTTSRIHRTLSRLPLGDSLVIMKIMFRPKDYFPDGWWASGFLYNDPRLRGRLIYAQDRGRDNEALLRCFPERKAYLYVGTLDKGMLTPMRLDSGLLRYGEPISFRPAGGRFVELVGTPEEMFFAYSDPFRKYLESVFAEYAPRDIDVVRLTRSAARAKSEGRSQDAVFALEAALQIEPGTSARSRLLGQLAPLYARTGDLRGAKRIFDSLSDLHDPRVFDVLPERGF